MSTKTLVLTPELYEYLLKYSLHEPELLGELRRVTHQLPQKNMQISPEQGQFMALLVKLLQAKKTLDVGTFTGYSALAVALALPAEGQVIACDINEEWTQIAREFWQKAGVANKIDLRIAPALSTLLSLIPAESGTFDFAFIDADKGGYIDYYEATLSLLRQGGLCVIDNVLREGKVADINNEDRDTKAIRKFNEFIFNDNRVDISMLPMSDGLTLARKK